MGKPVPIGPKFHGDSIAIELRFGLSAFNEVSSACHGRSHCAVEVLHTRNHARCKFDILLVQRPEPPF